LKGNKSWDYKTNQSKQLLIDILITVFPFAAQMLVKGLIQISDSEFNEMMEERKPVSPNKLLIRLKNETNKHPIYYCCCCHYFLLVSKHCL
jgi:hypothetical protein